MPLREHFKKTLSMRQSWEAVHASWPVVIVGQINRALAPRYFAVPQVHLGAYVEIDMATMECDQDNSAPEWSPGGGSGTALWSPPEPTATLESDMEPQSEYEVRIYDAERGERLVAAIELISPANKDRPEHRRAFVAKCLGLLWKEISLVLVDPVTTRSSNLFREIWEEIGGTPPSGDESAMHAVSIRPCVENDRLKVVTWEHTLAVGKPLPTLPLWLNQARSIPLDLESSYEETCRTLRIPNA